MARRRKKKSNAPDEVTLNLAAMLDMAFQLLAFFILTFQPPAQEGQILLRLPPPIPIGEDKGTAKVGADPKNITPLIATNTLIINVYADTKTGTIDTMAIGTDQVGTLSALDARLKKIFADRAGFDQVVIQVSESCRYEELMKIIDICTHQTLADGKKLGKLSFAGLPDVN